MPNKRLKIFNYRDFRLLRRRLKTKRKARKMKMRLQIPMTQKISLKPRPGHGKRSLRMF